MVTEIVGLKARGELTFSSLHSTITKTNKYSVQVENKR